MTNPLRRRIGIDFLTTCERIETGRLRVRTPEGHVHRFGGTGIEAELRINDWAAVTALLARGDIGFGEGYVAGLWDTPEIEPLVTLGLLNEAPMRRYAVPGRWHGLAFRVLDRLVRQNSIAGSGRNTRAHYDVGNEFYGEWLDPSFTYSSALFDDGDDLERAQMRKYDRILDRLGGAERLLEIGCGWGALAECAVREHGARVTGVTLSTEQLEFARQRLAGAGLLAQAELRLQDYRDIADGPFDAIVSIEMFEAVGREYWASWFDTVRRNLKPGGRACVQTITIRDDLFDRYLDGTDFIQQYIFPGGLLPSPGQFRAEAQRAGLVVDRELAFGADYAETLRRWRADFLRQEDAVRAQGFDTRFVRTWEFYLAYCEAAFAAGSTDVVQFTLRHA